MAQKILTAAINGLGAEIVKVEADSGGGEFGQIAIVGLPDTAVSEARERVKSALKNCGYSYPKRKLTVNLAPAHIKKQGSGYDLPIAICIISLNNRFNFDFSQSFFGGELSLDGEIRPLRSVLPLLLAAKRAGLNQAFIPQDNLAEASLITGIKLYAVNSLQQILLFLKTGNNLNPCSIDLTSRPKKIDNLWEQIKGQETAKRALTIAAAGRHNLIMFGPPGSGKSLLAQSLISLLPELNTKEQLEVAQIYSVAGELPQIIHHLERPPWRAPHHNASLAAILGGGRGPKPGEITLAHNGVLFLDELAEFPRQILDSLRQPLEQRQILISRAEQHLYYPAKFLLIAAMNPCPCGYFGDDRVNCTCTQAAVSRYQQKISGPLWERFDLQLNIRRVSIEKLAINREKATKNPLSEIKRANQKQQERQQTNNAMVSDNLLHQWQKDSPQAEKLALQAAESLNLSARSYYRLFRIARTIADLADQKNITPEHIAEALSYRHELR